MVPAMLGHTSPPLLVGRNLPEGPLAPSWSPRQSRRLQDTPETPTSLAHLQDECLAVKGNLDGVHSVPIFLWEGRKGSREVGGG